MTARRQRTTWMNSAPFNGLHHPANTRDYMLPLTRAPAPAAAFWFAQLVAWAYARRANQAELGVLDAGFHTSTTTSGTPGRRQHFSERGYIIFFTGFTSYSSQGFENGLGRSPNSN